MAFVKRKEAGKDQSPVLTTDRPSRLPAWWSPRALLVYEHLKRLLKQHFPGQFERLLRIAEFAQECHKDQRRAGGEAYIVHPYRVAVSIIEEFGIPDPDLAAAALLHDVIEDSNVAPVQLAQSFGRPVAALASVLTRNGDKPRGGEKADSDYIQGIRACGDPAILIKAADKLDNLRDALRHPDSRKRQRTLREAIQVYLPLARELSDPRMATRISTLLQIAINNHSSEQKEWH